MPEPSATVSIRISLMFKPQRSARRRIQPERLHGTAANLSIDLDGLNDGVATSALSPRPAASLPPWPPLSTFSQARPPLS